MLHEGGQAAQLTGPNQSNTKGNPTCHVYSICGNVE